MVSLEWEAVVCITTLWGKDYRERERWIVSGILANLRENEPYSAYSSKLPFVSKTIENKYLRCTVRRL